MTEVSSERLETTRLVGRQLATQEGRSGLARSGYAAGTPIIPCEWDTSVDELVHNVREARPGDRGAAIAIRRGSELYWMGIVPSTPQERTGTDDDVHAATTMGAMYQAAAHGWSVRITHLSIAKALVPA